MGWLPLTLLGVLTVLTFVADIVATGARAKKAGASKQAVIGATIGAIPDLGHFEPDYKTRR